MQTNMVKLVNEQNVLVVKYTDEVTFENSNKIKEETKKLLKEEFSKKENKNLVIDLVEVPYLDSSGIGVLLSIFKFMRLKNGTAVIANANERINRVLDVTKITEIINSYNSVEEAVNDFNS